MNSPMRTRRMVMGAALIVAVAGCGGVGADEQAQDSRGSSPAPRPASESPRSAPPSASESPTPQASPFDPPRAFDVSAGVELPATTGEGKITNGGSIEARLPVTLHGTVAFVAESGGLTVVDGVTGATLGRFEPTGGATEEPDVGLVNEDVTAPPSVVQVNGRTLAVVPVIANITGTGTTADRRVLELIAVDAETMGEAWRLQVGLPEWAQDAYTSVSPVNLGAAGNQMLVRLGNAGIGEETVTLAVDLARQKLIWRQKGFAGQTVADGVVVGFDTRTDSIEYPVTALGVTDGAKRWASPKPAPWDSEIHPGGPKFVVVEESSATGGDARLKIYSAASGKVVSDEAGAYLGVDCHYDEISVTVCEQGFWGGWVAAFDANSGEWLWGLPDRKHNRVAPAVRTAWHGIVYGETRNGPVLLDAATGTDLPQVQEVAPAVVNEYLGVALREGVQLVLYPTAG